MKLDDVYHGLKIQSFCLGTERERARWCQLNASRVAYSRFWTEESAVDAESAGCSWMQRWRWQGPTEELVCEESAMSTFRHDWRSTARVARHCRSGLFSWQGTQEHDPGQALARQTKRQLHLKLPIGDRTICGNWRFSLGLSSQQMVNK